MACIHSRRYHRLISSTPDNHRRSFDWFRRRLILGFPILRSDRRLSETVRSERLLRIVPDTCDNRSQSSRVERNRGVVSDSPSCLSHGSRSIAERCFPIAREQSMTSARRPVEGPMENSRNRDRCSCGDILHRLETCSLSIESHREVAELARWRSAKNSSAIR